MSVLVRRVRDCCVFKLLDNRAHRIFVRLGRVMVAIRLDLSRRQYMLHRVEKQIRIVQGPEIDVQCVQAEQELALVAGIAARQVPFISACTWRRRG